MEIVCEQLYLNFFRDTPPVLAALHVSIMCGSGVKSVRDRLENSMLSHMGEEGSN